MRERIRFHFDPICPWCYQTSRWLKHVEALGAAELTWGLFSLELRNAGASPDDLPDLGIRAARPLATAAAVREVAGHRALGAFYGAFGARVHERGERLRAPETLHGALEDIGLDPALADRAAEDPRYLKLVAADHRAVEETRSFGVPTIILDAGEGPALFGPVVTEPPSTDAEALELFGHVVWLARYDGFAELKRDRDEQPDLESVRKHERRLRQRA